MAKGTLKRVGARAGVEARKSGSPHFANGAPGTSRPTSFRVVEGSVTAPKGFRAGAVFCDIKRLGTGKGSNKGKKRDLAILVSDARCAVAGMFTTSQVCAAPVKVSAKR